MIDKILISSIAGLLMFFIFSKKVSAKTSNKPEKDNFIYEPFIIEKTYSKDEINNLIKKYAEKYSIEERLLRAIIMVESSFNYKAENKEGSFGLCQIHKNLLIGYYPEFKNKSIEEIRKYLFNPENNLDIAGTFLKHLFKRYKEKEKVIQAYNLGETKFDKGYTSPEYLKKVLYYYNIGI